jgi:hypothetical protein
MITKMLIQQLHNDGLDEVAELIERQQAKISELEKALDKLIDRAQQVDSWESFPESWLDEAVEALKEPKT